MWFLRLSAFLFFIFLFSCVPQHAEQKRVFNFRVLSEPETLDWNRAHTPIETHLLVNLMEGLLSLDEQARLVPALAQSWKLSADGKTYTFYLRPGVKWSDGKSLTAGDFVYSWKRLLSPGTAALYAYFLYDVEGAENYNKGLTQDFNQVGIKALDDHTLQVRLMHPIAHWIYIPTYWVTFPLRKDIVEKYGSQWAEPGKMVTLGPYVLTSHSLESKFVMDANPFYYGQRGNVSQLVGWIVNDSATALNLYESGHLDFLGDISTLDLKRLEGRKDLKTYPYLKTVYLGFCTKRPAMGEKNLRKAIAYSIDRSQMGEILHGGQQRATSLVPAPMMAYSKKIGIPYDPKKGKELLSRAQSLDLLVLNHDKSMILAQFIQNELKKNLNIEVNLQSFDNKTFRSKVNSEVTDLFILSWSADYPDPDTFLSLFLGGAGNNHTGWKNTFFDEGVIKARALIGSSLVDIRKRESLYLQLQKILLEEDVVLLPLFYEPNRVLVKSRVKNLELNPMNYLILKKVTLD